MNTASTDLASRAETLRREFDAGFAAPVNTVTVSTVALVGIRVNDSLFALTLDQASEILKGPHVTPVPGASREFLGVMSYRGELMPVYSLRRLLGLEDAPSTWILILNSASGLAVTFDSYAGHLSLPEVDFTAGDSGPGTGLIKTLVRVRGEFCSVIDTSKLLEMVERICGRGGHGREQ